MTNDSIYQWNTDHRGRGAWSLAVFILGLIILALAGVSVEIKCSENPVQCHLHSQSLLAGATDTHFALSDVVAVHPDFREHRNSSARGTQVTTYKQYVIELANGKEIAVYTRLISPMFLLFDPMKINYAAKGNGPPPNGWDLNFGLIPALIAMVLFISAFALGCATGYEHLRIEDEKLNINRRMMMSTLRLTIPLRQLQSIWVCKDRGGALLAELNDGRSMIISFQDETVTELTTILIDHGARDALESTSLVPTITDGKPDLLGGLIVLVIYTLLFAVFLQSLSQFLRG